MARHREAALLLHALESADQRWVLDQLDAQESKLLRDYLKELHALGIPRDRTLTREAPPMRLSGSAARIHAASAAEIVAVLDSEPRAVLAALLAQAEWPWASTLLGTLPPLERDGLALDAAVALAPGAAAALLDEVAGRLERLPGLRTKPAAASAGHGWAQRLARLVSRKS